MTSLFKKLSVATVIAVSFAVSMLFVATQPAFANGEDSARAGICLTNPNAAGCAGGTDPAINAEGTIGSVVETIIDVLSIIVGAVSVIMIIIGGFRYIISAGDSSSTAAAKNTILYAIVGLVIVIFAQTIVIFVVDRVDGATTTETTETVEE